MQLTRRGLYTSLSHNLQYFALSICNLQCSAHGAVQVVSCRLREHPKTPQTPQKKMFSFGHCPNKGGGDLPMPDFLAPFFYQVIVLKIAFFTQTSQ